MQCIYHVHSKSDATRMCQTFYVYAAQMACITNPKFWIHCTICQIDLYVHSVRLELPDVNIPVACELPSLTHAWKFWRKFFRAPGKNFRDK